MPPADRIEELKKKFDENPRRYFAPLANEYRKAGDLAQAISICRTHLPQQPGHMSGHIVYGQALFENGELDEARTVFQTALELDPENLIALRHLGDIALRTGDEATARRWYERVLETDPRNEEITAVLQGIAPAAPAPAPAAEPAPTPGPIQAPSPLDDMAIELVGSDDPQAVNLDARSEGVEIIPAHVVEPTGLAGDQSLELLDLSTDLPAASPVAPPAASGRPSAPAARDDAGHELLDLDSSMFGAPAEGGGNASGAGHPPLEITATVLHTDEQETESAAGNSSLLEGLEPTHFEGPSADAPPPALAGLEPQDFEPPPPEVQPPRISQAFPSLEEFAGLSHDGAPADSTPLQDPPPRPAPAFDDLPFIDTAAGVPEAPAPEPVPQPSPESATPWIAGRAAGEEPPSLEKLPEFEPLDGAPAGSEPEAYAPEPAVAEAVDDEPVSAGATPARATPSSSVAFVTETMAELYIQQGFPDRAAGVYRQLLEQRPGDAGLRGRLHAVEAQMAAAAPTPATGLAVVEAGPSIREFLGRFAARRPREAMPYVPTPPAPQAALPDVDAEGAELPAERDRAQEVPPPRELTFIDPYAAAAPTPTPPSPSPTPPPPPRARSARSSAAR